MASISHPPAGPLDERSWSSLLRIREMWASLAIVVMWVAVAVSAVWGSDFVSTNGDGPYSTTIPTGIAVAMFAAIGTWAIAKYVFGSKEAR
jgi:hypothetical protein